MSRGAAPVLIVCLMVVVFTAPVMRPGSFQGHETSIKTVQRIHQMDSALRSGHLPPRWAPDFAGGAGTPFFIFYPPLFMYIACIFTFLHVPITVSISLSIAVLTLFGVYGVYRYSREMWGEWGAWISTGVFTLFPYHMVQLYTRGAYAEYSAGMVLPWVFYSVRMYGKTRKTKWGTGVAVSTCLMMLSHNAIALMVIPLALIYILWQPWRDDPRILYVLAWFGGGITASMFFWAPALFEISDVKVHLMREGYFDIGVHFAFLHQLLGNLWGYGPSIAGPDDKLPFQIGPILLLLAIWGVFLGWHRDMERRGLVFWITVSIGVFCANLDVSVDIWRRIPGLNFSQFPWRSLTILALPLSLLAGGAAARSGSDRQYSRVAAVCLVLCTVAYSGRFVRAPSYTDLSSLPLDRQIFKSQWITTTASGEYVPRWVSDHVVPVDLDECRVDDGTARVRNLSVRAEELHLNVSVETPAKLLVRRFYYPGWRATLDGVNLPIFPSQNGYIGLNAPPGDHSIRIWFDTTWKRRICDGLSLVSIILVIGALIRSRYRQPGDSLTSA